MNVCLLLNKIIINFTWIAFVLVILNDKIFLWIVWIQGGLAVEIYIGRQPIFDLYGQVGAYELLYRSKGVNGFNALNPDMATVDVIVNAFLNFGIEQVANGKPCFVNFTENLLIGPLADFLNPKQVVIEVLEDVPITPKIIERIWELKAMGFRIALDDFILNDRVDIYRELFTIIDYIKVDFLLSPLEKCVEMDKEIRQQFPHIRLLAEKVETHEQLEVAKCAGYELFQGYFFEKPQVMTMKDLPSSMVQCFQVMSLLNAEEPNVNAIAEVIERDIALSYKLLHLINSYHQRGKSSIQSIKQAILMLGLIDLKKWMYLLAMQENTTKQDYELNVELMRISLFRAKVCELLAKKSTNVRYSKCFLVGLFSLMDALLQKPMEEIVDKLPLSAVVSNTITGHETKVTPYLQCSIALEKMNFDQVGQILAQLNIEDVNVQDTYNTAFQWADDATKAF